MQAAKDSTAKNEHNESAERLFATPRAALLRAARRLGSARVVVAVDVAAESTVYRPH